jgi:outer membrane murein-binding lipoprotein Lpp
MSKEKLEKDFQDFNMQIEKLAEDEVKSIKEKVDAIKMEAVRVGEAVEVSVKETKAK